MTEKPFWETVALADMTREEWESLCDGCGKCCLLKLEDEDTLDLSYTDVACRLLDMGSCRCSCYEERSRLVPDCVTLTPDIIPNLRWMPKTCAYRLISEGKPLRWWHPLVSHDPETVHQAGISVRGRVVSERRAGDLEEHIVDWPDEDSD
ncbi:MAG: hypothetical protein CMN55_08990 [Sneathiella sp.]|uniref:YcgN family cysteine cluster protein n=1 Tax=Sneathiella sp. TaxID=1964365 RepID=UPI000C574546|nr:YcgN family cysteine cluster protein [Sneathiella sp.]MAL79232.1 hypothetical protein [Sneathiella sp.]